MRAASIDCDMEVLPAVDDGFRGVGAWGFRFDVRALQKRDVACWDCASDPRDITVAKTAPEVASVVSGDSGQKRCLTFTKSHRCLRVVGGQDGCPALDVRAGIQRLLDGQPK